MKLSEDQYRMVVLWRTIRFLAQRCEKHENDIYQTVGTQELIRAISLVNAMEDEDVKLVYSEVCECIRF